MAKQKKPPKVNMKQVEKIIAGYRDRRWPLIPMVEEIQKKVGYIPPESIPVIADASRLFPTQVQGVVTFYEQLYTEPRGKNIVRVCRGTACHVRGGGVVLDQVKLDLGIEENESTEDMEYTLETVACIGACALAPAMVIDEDTFGKVTPGRVSEIFASRKGDN